MTDASDTARLARRLYAARQHGVLSTVSVELTGFPFGSVVTYAADRAGRPLMLISAIAEHTRNIGADSRVALTLTEDGEDAQAAGRLTLLGRATPVPAPEQADAAARYYRRFPQAEEYRRAHAFDLYRIEPVRIRYIGGFGRIHWLEPRELCRPNPFAETVEVGMLAHMNRDHVDALRGYCRLAAVAPAIPPRLAAIDGEGFDILLGKRLLRIAFETPVDSADDVRRAMVALAQRARGTEAQPA